MAVSGSPETMETASSEEMVAVVRVKGQSLNSPSHFSTAFWDPLLTMLCGVGPGLSVTIQLNQEAAGAWRDTKLAKATKVGPSFANT